MRIATWNVERPKLRHGARRAALATWMARIDADVWVLTETSTHLTPGDGYVAVSSRGADRDGENEERWVTIWSRLPLIEAIETSDPIRTACARVRMPDGAPLVVYGSVLPWLGSPWREHAARDCQAFKAALSAQAGDWRRIRREHVAAEVCIAGDLNQDLRGRHYYGSRAGKTALARAIEEAGMVCVTGGDRDPVDRQTSGGRGSIDHICLSTTLAGLAGQSQAWPQMTAPERTLSDHFGAWVDIAVGDPS